MARVLVGVLLRMVSDFGIGDGDGGIFFLLGSFLGVGRWGDIEVLNLGC